MRRVLVAGVLALLGLAGPASAQSASQPGFSVVYDIKAKGLVAGEFALQFARAGDAYKATATRKSTGIARMALKKSQDYTYAARGIVGPNGAVMPAFYEHTGGKSGRHVQVTFTPDDITTVATPNMGMGNPPATREQRVGAIDQVSSVLAMAMPAGDPCARTVRVYMDGRSRFDLVMSPNGTEKVSTSAFKGTAKRCSVQFKPIAGFGDPQEPATMTFLFAPVGGLYAPIRIAMPSDDAGVVTLEAKKFAAE